jgi:hypothetical protein
MKIPLREYNYIVSQLNYAATNRDWYIFKDMLIRIMAYLEIEEEPCQPIQQ